MDEIRESKIEKDVVKWSRTKGLLPLKLTPRGEAGWPDHFWLFMYPSIAFIEFKRPGEKPRPLQEVRIAELRERGYPVKVIDNVADGIAFLDATFFPKDGS